MKSDCRIKSDFRLPIRYITDSIASIETRLH